jgi:hypothetical protein
MATSTSRIALFILLPCLTTILWLVSAFLADVATTNDAASLVSEIHVDIVLSIRSNWSRDGKL